MYDLQNQLNKCSKACWEAQADDIWAPVGRVWCLASLGCCHAWKRCDTALLSACIRTLPSMLLGVVRPVPARHCLQTASCPLCCEGRLPMISHLPHCAQCSLLPCTASGSIQLTHLAMPALSKPPACGLNQAKRRGMREQESVGGAMACSKRRDSNGTSKCNESMPA